MIDRLGHNKKDLKWIEDLNPDVRGKALHQGAIILRQEKKAVKVLHQEAIVLRQEREAVQVTHPVAHLHQAAEEAAAAAVQMMVEVVQVMAAEEEGKNEN